MREIKFRGFSINKKKWVYGNYNYTFERGYLSQGYDDVPPRCYYIDTETNYYEVYSQSIGQYTGLKDKNGKEIFEGDILDLSFFMTSNRGIVKYGKNKPSDMDNDYECGNQGFYVDVTNDKHSSWRKDIWFYHSHCEVIGNIYDNAELLEV